MGGGPMGAGTSPSGSHGYASANHRRILADTRLSVHLYKSAM